MAGAIVDLGNNKWELRVSLGYDLNNKQIRKTKRITAKSRQAADKELAKFYVDVTNKPIAIASKVTFGEFIQIWEERYAKKLSNTTFYRNKAILDNRILPAFHQKILDKITATDVLRFIDSLRQVGMRMDGKETAALSDATVKMHYKLIRSIFNKAVQWQYASVNPCDTIAKEDLPKAKIQTHCQFVFINRSTSG
ncbi:site-specific integrase [Sporomusaceae bacterium FL31]|nr:site-specific integrase [Sporomusaceae bacterium FL31]GCE32620.1 site-specific integrase [Sporomusaceae bacterium]